ncbi:E3 ubiquitin-protein ligase RNF139 isoform X2 [Ailuropoda melanoleuca]|uniref:E3 ubiquitin-protein ligase RNF139 isoform X2 n=1 Tax=Ailuropoda melanoleuca TaxID=9646 RepID=UPI00149406F9|nr:E3 ubiquitin-protein ligase RNF139 isoform X2 [Ailuropoda melanoleuca]
MAAVGPPQQQVRMAHQQVWAALEVALRVPCLYIIDAIFNSYYDSSQSRFCIGLQIFLRLLEIRGSLSEENEATQKDPDKLTFRNPCQLMGCLPTEIPKSIFLNFLNTQLKNCLTFEESHDRD